MTLKPLPETSVLVAASTKCFVQIYAFTQFEQSYPCKTAYVVVYPSFQRPFYVIVSSASTSVIKLAKYMLVVTESPPPSEIPHIKNDEHFTYPPQSSKVDSVNGFNH